MKKEKEKKLKINGLDYRVDLDKIRGKIKDVPIEDIPRATSADFKKLKSVRAKIERIKQENKKIMEKYKG
jgi:hypothetical protein